jgi:drug/metabolite transporter (DMT)-like permease
MPSVSDVPVAAAVPPAPGAGAVLAPTPARFTATDVMLVTMALIWGVNFSVMKYGAAAMSPPAFNALRAAIAALALAVIAFSPGRNRPAWSDATRLMLLGLLGHAVYQLFFLQGLHRARAGTAALIVAGTPALIAILLQLTGQERITRRAAGGIALSLSGIALVVTAAATPASGADDSLLGVLLICCASLCWAFYTLGLRPLTHRVDGIQVAAWTLFGGVGPMVLMGLPALLRTDFGALPAAAWGAVGYSAIMAFVVAYYFWYRGVKTLGPVRTSMYANLQPIIAMAVAWLVLHETPTLLQFIGASCVIGGVYLARK